MSQLSSSQILKAQRNLDNHYLLTQMRKRMNSNQLKISKQVYDLQSRNIRKFTKEWQAIKKKFRMGEHGDRESRSLPIKKLKDRYDDNRLMELSFSGKFDAVATKPVQDEASVLSIRNSSQGGDSSSRNVTFKTSIKHGYSFRINYVEHSKSRVVGPRQNSNSLANDRFSLRKRMGTQWDLSPLKQSEISLQKTNAASNAQYRATDQFIIDVTRDKMERFIKNMHRLEWAYTFLKDSAKGQAEQSKEFRNHMKKFQFDSDSPIDEQAINFMVSRRYNLHTHYVEDIYEQRDRFLTEQTHCNQRKKLAEEGEYPLISSLANHSILGLLQKRLQTRKNTSASQMQENSYGNDVYFSLPFSEFISFKETKNSIYQLVGMSARMGLKMAFGVFDKNRNGVIDEDDLLQLISLSRQMPNLQIDIATLARAMLSINSKRSLSQRPRLTKQESGESRLRESRQRNTTMMSKQSEEPSNISPIEERDSDSESQVNQKSLSNSRFSIHKLYIFLKDKEKGSTKHTGSKNKSANIQSLNFVAFCKAFEFKRPYLVYDLLQFIFGASLGDFKQHIQAQITVHLNKLQMNHSPQLYVEQDEQTLQEKWNERLKKSNAILLSFIKQKQQ